MNLRVSNHRLLAATLLLTACAHGAASGADRSVAPGSGRIEVDKHALAFHVFGHGPPCIVHPGGPGAEWSYLRMPEVEQHLTLIYLEPVGTGTSGRLASPNDYSYARYAADVEALRVHLGVERICVLGHSHGGLVALTYAVTHPEHLSGLILYGTAANLDAEWRQSMRANMQALFGDRAWFADARAGLSAFYAAQTDEQATRAFRQWMPLLFADWDAMEPSARDRFGALTVRAGPAAYRGPVFDVRADLGKIRAPTLIITGRRDYAMTPATAGVIQAGIPGSRVVVLEHGGHMAHLEEPHEFAQAIAAFVPSMTQPAR